MSIVGTATRLPATLAETSRQETPEYERGTLGPANAVPRHEHIDEHEHFEPLEMRNHSPTRKPS